MSKQSAPPERTIDDARGAIVAASWAIVFSIVVAALYLGRDLLIPIALASLLAFVLSPLVSYAKRLKIPRPPAVALVVAIAFGVIVGLGAILAGQVGQLAGDLPQYQSTIRDKIQSLKGWTGGSGTLERAAEMLESLNQELNRKAVTAETLDADTAKQSGEPLPVEVRQPPRTAMENLRDIAAALLHPMATTGIIFIFVIFILLQREDLRNRLIGLAGSHDIQRTTAAIDDAARRLARLFLTQLMLNAGFGLAIGLGLFAIGVPGAGLWGIMAGVLRFVPYVGAVMAAVFPLLLAAAVDPGWATLIATLVLFATVEPIVGHLIEPMIYGRTTGLSPFAVVVSATFWTALWGPIGLILATPLTVCLVVLGRHAPALKFLDTMFGDRPALSPPELFYQRMLARDPAEAAEKAREFLRERSLSSYYEEVAIPGLLLAQADAERGAIEGDRLMAVRESVAEVVEDLGDWSDDDPQAEPPTTDPEAVAAIEATAGDGDRESPVVANAEEIGPKTAKYRVRCVGGRTPVEEGAASILGQILAKHGFLPQIEDEDFLLTTGVVEMESAGPSMVCAVFLDADESHLRLIVRRLRRRLPQSFVVVVCWSATDRGLSPEDLVRSCKADAAALSLRAAVEICVQNAKLRALAPDERRRLDRAAIPA